MSSLEDILMEAEYLGIREKVLKKSAAVGERLENKYRSIKEIYNIAMEEVKKETSDEDTRIWDSALVKSTKYRRSNQSLEVEFNNGRRYLYQDFSDDLYLQFIKSESKGKFFLTKIRQEYIENGKVKQL